METELQKLRKGLRKVDTVVREFSGRQFIEGEANPAPIPQEGEFFIADESQDDEISEVLSGHLFVSSEQGAHNPAQLQHHKITHIVNLIDDVEPHHVNGISYRYFPLRDEWDEDLMLPDIIPHIDSVISEGGRILVHCVAGASRSPAISIAYLILKKGFQFGDALRLLQTVRPATFPNAGFLRQLKQLKG